MWPSGDSATGALRRGRRIRKQPILHSFSGTRALYRGLVRPTCNRGSMLARARYLQFGSPFTPLQWAVPRSGQQTPWLATYRHATRSTGAACNSRPQISSKVPCVSSRCSSRVPTRRRTGRCRALRSPHSHTEEALNSPAEPRLAISRNLHDCHLGEHPAKRTSTQSAANRMRGSLAEYAEARSLHPHRGRRGDNPRLSEPTDSGQGGLPT